MKRVCLMEVRQTLALIYLTLAICKSDNGHFGPSRPRCGRSESNHSLKKNGDVLRERIQLHFELTVNVFPGFLKLCYYSFHVQVFIPQKADLLPFRVSNLLFIVGGFFTVPRGRRGVISIGDISLLDIKFRSLIQ